MVSVKKGCLCAYSIVQHGYNDVSGAVIAEKPYQSLTNPASMFALNDLPAIGSFAQVGLSVLHSRWKQFESNS